MSALEPAVPISYSPTDAARVIGLSRSTIYELLARGQIKARKAGGRTIIERSELSRFIEALPDANIGGSSDREAEESISPEAGG